MCNDKSKIGIVYVAFGYEYLLMAAYSALTAKQYNPGITSTIITNIEIRDKGLLQQYFDNIIYEKIKNDLNRHIKTSVIDYVSFDKGAFLDCDTEVLGDFGPMLACLDKFDVALKLTQSPTAKDYRISQNIHGSEFPMWNSGVIFFKNDMPAQKLFTDWQKFFLEMGKKSDQPALARAIYENPEIKILSVNCVWNTFPTDLMILKKGRTVPSRIWHYRNPQDFPQVAKRIYKHHPTVAAAIKSSKVMDQEIEKIANKYSTLSSSFYQHGLLRPFYIGWTKILSKLRLRTKPVLSRTKHRAGSRFEKNE